MVDRTRLRDLELFAGLSDGELEQVASLADERAADAGATIVSQDDYGYALYLVEEGEAAVVQDGEHVATLGRGDVFGELGLLATGRRTASVVASSPLRLLTFFDSDYRRLERELPELARRVRASMAERQSRTGA